MCGMMYMSGQGHPVDRKRGAFWMEKSAQQEHPEGQYRYGMLFALGQGVEPSSEQALYWLRRAAANGSVRAKRALDALQTADNQ